jgi:hypothetical protein
LHAAQVSLFHGTANQAGKVVARNMGGIARRNALYIACLAQGIATNFHRN